MGEVAIVSDYAGELFARQLSNRFGFNYVHAEIKNFPDGECDVQVTGNIRGKDVFYISPFQPNPKVRFTEIMLVHGALKYASGERLVSVPTYLGFMKKDWKDKPRVPISIREVTAAIENYANRVLTIDMHSPQTEGMFRIPVDHLDGTVMFADHIKRNYNGDEHSFTIASPDVGGAKRAQKLAERSGANELALVYKIRNPRTGVTRAMGVMGDVKDKDVILIDDQAVTVGSLAEAARAVKEQGARKVVAYCTHGVLVPRDGVPAETILANSEIERLYITDTIPRPPEYFEHNKKIGLISCVELFGEAIRRVHNNESLSQLFR